jgi:hypothetical protein
MDLARCADTPLEPTIQILLGIGFDSGDPLLAADLPELGFVDERRLRSLL